jgi:DNA-binding response OmpR family regulator
MATSDQDRRKFLKAILLDDDAAQAYLLARMLSQIDWLDCDLSHYTQPEDTTADLLCDKADLLSLDHHLGGTETGLDVLRSLREAGVTTPIVMLTGRDDDELISDFERNGADAYLSKSDLDPGRIGATIRVALTRPHRATQTGNEPQNR